MPCATIISEYSAWELDPHRSELFREAAASAKYDSWSEDEGRSELFIWASAACELEQWEEESARSSLFKWAQQEIEQGQSGAVSTFTRLAEERIESLEKRKIHKQNEVDRPRCAALLLAVAHLRRASLLNGEERQILKSLILEKSAAVYAALSAFEVHMDSDKFMNTLCDIADVRLRQAVQEQWFEQNEYMLQYEQARSHMLSAYPDYDNKPTTMLSPSPTIFIKSEEPESPQGVADFDAFEFQSPTAEKRATNHPRTMSFLEL